MLHHILNFCVTDQKIMYALNAAASIASSFCNWAVSSATLN